MNRAAVLVVAVIIAGGATTGALAFGDDDGVSTVEELMGPTDPLASDTDGDGLDDGAEFERSTDSTIADTDDDGVPDGREVAAGTDPTTVDTDGDGLDDGRELALGTSPTVADSDSDGSNDRAEATVHGTNPTRKDTDGDGLDDAVELNDRPTSPTKSDTDGDGLSDGAEVNERPTDPVVADTDGDGLDDGAEVREYGTDPTTADIDADSLADGREVSLGTDPTSEDTDGDGFNDGVEVHDESMLAGSDPTRKDVFLEIDYMAGTSVPEQELEAVKRAFENAPVENPDGTHGINLHVRTGDAPVESDPATSLVDYVSSYYESARDGSGYGYYHALVVREVPDSGGGNRVGLTSTGIDGMLVEHRPDRVRVAKTLMHELGHNLGLHPSTHRGVDSYDVPPKRYPSVMNYHRLGSCDCHYDYSDGTHGPGDFDDWSRIASVLARQTPNTSAAEAHVEERAH